MFTPVPNRLNVWGLFTALSLMLRVPVNGPVVVGVNVTLTVQLEAAASVAGETGQVLVSAKLPVVEILEKVKGVAWLLVTVTVWAALVVFTTWLPKFNDCDDDAEESDTAATCNKMETVLSELLVTAKSSLPSLLKSPMATDKGTLPVAGDEGEAVNVPSPLPNRIVTVLLAKFGTAKSNFPSPLKSPTATEFGALPVAGDEAVGVKVPSPFPNRIVTLLLLLLATAKSGFPSPLKSPIATEFGLVPVAGDEGEAVNVPSPLPNRIVTVLPKVLATAKSSFPSPLK